MAIVLLAVVIVLFDNLKEKRSVPSTKVRYCVFQKNLAAHQLKMAEYNVTEMPQ